jgi:hypothetical protein
VGGNLTGEYALLWYYYDDDKKEFVLATDAMSIKHGGTEIFGTISAGQQGTVSTLSPPQQYRLFGYFRWPVLALAYENEDPAGNSTSE